MSTNLTIIIILGFIAGADALLYFLVPSMRKYAAVFARVSIGMVFLFSGFVKSVDPLGVGYKIHDYLMAFNLSWLLPASTTFGVLLNLAEFLIGFVVLFGIRMRIFAWGALLFMVFFTPLTLYLALKNPVTDCGCFGDFLVMTNWETFYKNLVFLTFAIITLSYRTRYYNRMFSKGAKKFIIIAGVAIGVGIQVYALRYDALIDFRPWKIGNNIAEQVVPTMEKSEMRLAYKNNTTGKEEVYTTEDLPWEDSLRMANLTFVEQRKTVTQPYKEAPIHDFIITGPLGENFTEQVIANPNYHFIVVAYDLSTTRKKSFKKLMKFAEQCAKDSLSFVAITGSTPNEIEAFTKTVKPNFPMYSADATALKTIIRSNPGILLLKNGYILDKWAHRKMIPYEAFKANLKRYELDYQTYSAKRSKNK